MPHHQTKAKHINKQTKSKGLQEELFKIKQPMDIKRQQGEGKTMFIKVMRYHHTSVRMASIKKTETKMLVSG